MENLTVNGMNKQSFVGSHVNCRVVRYLNDVRPLRFIDMLMGAGCGKIELITVSFISDRSTIQSQPLISTRYSQIDPKLKPIFSRRKKY